MFSFLSCSPVSESSWNLQSDARTPPEPPHALLSGLGGAVFFTTGHSMLF